VQDDEALIQLTTPEEGTQGLPVRKVTRGELEAMWDGELVLITTRESMLGQAGRFDFTWFIPRWSSTAS
jgi:subfamily B ATP-binding cassette protein HlyB/CyaB